jgi:hypothetical protein
LVAAGRFVTHSEYRQPSSASNKASWAPGCGRSRRANRVRLRYTGTVNNDAWLHNRCAAINLRALLRHGLTRSGKAWVLA